LSHTRKFKNITKLHTPKSQKAPFKQQLNLEPLNPQHKMQLFNNEA